MRKNLLLSGIAVVLFSLPVFAEESQNKDIGVTFQLDYLSQWLSKGAPAYGSHGAVFATIDIELWDSGFGVKTTHRNSTSSGYVDKQRIDYRPYFKSKLFEGSPYQINYDISAGYEHYYGMARKMANTTWEWIFDFTFPNILPKGFTPKYIAHYEYPAGSGHKYHYITGWVHRFLLSYDLSVPQLPAPLTLSSEVAYTDGLGGAEHDWSYAVFGLSTKVKINENLSFSPGIYQQVSMEDSVCDHDVTYCILTMKYKF